MSQDDAFSSAVQFHGAGKLAEAEPLYRAAIAQSSNLTSAKYLLALAIFQLRNDPEAIDLIRAAIASNPGEFEYHCNLGVMLAANERFDDALAAYQKALELNPASGEAYNNLANALLHLGRIEEAANACRRAVQFMPESVLAHYNLGNALIQMKQPEAAVTAYRAAVSLNPKFPEARSNLGNALSMLGRWREAADACRAAIELRPNFPAAHNNLAGALIGLGRTDEAISESRKAIEYQSNYADAYANLGNAYKDLRQFDDAIVAYKQAISLRPQHAPFHSNLGVVLLQAGKPDEAMIHIQRALVLDPNLSGAHNNLAGVLKDMGRISEAVDAYRKALELEPNSRSTRDNLILAAHYHPGFDGPALRREAGQWAKIHAEPFYARIPAHANDRDPDRLLRIGYVSADFREHVAGHTLLPLIRGHDRERFKIYCYSNARRPDAVTTRFQAEADAWRDIQSVSDEDAAKEIRKDEIDILVDVALFTAGNRLPIFARKPAPVQVTYLAYAGTSGLRTMDYRLSDPYLDPDDSDPLAYTEQTIRLAHSYWYYEPSGHTPGVLPLPSLAAGYITFGCLNNVAKISPAAVELWADLLSKVKDARILIHSTSNDHQQSVMSPFLKRAIDSSRVAFVGMKPWREFLDTLSRIDIALDPFPYAGGITTCDTLWMGVPVVTLSGPTAVGRGGRSILSNIGLPELIASTPAEYQRIASGVAADSARLVELRKTMRDRMKSSPLMNGAAFVADVESAYRHMWRNWCARPV
jgi:predicted O-linked N-acetylglucosamine transferase (SPINDLY family)